jgi:hypothetical protein
MERAELLIERLLAQYRSNAGTDKLMLTAQLLIAELQKDQKDEEQNAGQKVSVFYPASTRFISNTLNESAQEPLASEEKKSPPRTKIQGEAPANSQQPELFDPLFDIPTLALKRQELNETMAVKTESLNDKLKSSATRLEVAHTLKEGPVRDLRKAIGINDRYLFINELFRGDETMYDRSIKTINGFNIYGEAEFWIKRELKLKLGWKDDSEAVQVFDQLIKRRFA